MSKTRAIRFSEREEEQIEEFLRANPIFDFSSLARTAIIAFIRRPNLALKAVKGPRDRQSERITK
jgi:hypothetical protein